MPKVTSRLQARINSDLKAKLEALAAQDNMKFNDWLQLHLTELLQQYPGQIEVVDTVGVGNAPVYVPAQPIPDTSQGYWYTPVPQYPQQRYYPPQPDVLDSFVNRMEKMVVAQMFQDMIDRRARPQEVVAAAKGKEDVSMREMMQYIQMQNMMDRQVYQAQQQLEMARGRGDKKGETDALQLITALTTAQMQQQQNFMQQFMLANQQANATQQTLFNTALQTNRSAEESARQERSEFQQQVESVRADLTKTQIQSISDTNKLQLDFLNKELDRIRNEPKKDIIAQLTELLTLRSSSPVYKAAFDAAFGVKSEGGIGDLIPKLKDLGVDKVIDKVAGALGGLVTGMMTKPAIPLPTPASPTPTMPAPLPQPTPEELAKLSQATLPPTTTTQGQQPATSGQVFEQPGFTQPVAETAHEAPIPISGEPRPDNVGYSNLEQQRQTQNIMIPTETKQPENIALPPSQPTQGEQPFQGKTFTVGRKKKTEQPS